MRLRQVGRLLFKSFLALTVAWVASGTILYFTQEQYLFPAPRGSRGPVDGFETVHYVTEDGLRLTGAYRPPANGKPVLVFFHGNAADWQSGTAALGGLAKQGFGAFAAGYRGYGENPGKPGEQGLYRDGRATVKWLASRGVEPRQIILVGNSLGGGIATQLSGEYDVRGLVLISTFSSMEAIVAERVRWLPTSLLLRHRFDNAEKLRGSDVPVLLLHGDADSLIPAEHSRRLASAAPHADLQIIPGAGHDLAYLPAGQDALERWVANLKPPPP